MTAGSLSSSTSRSGSFLVNLRSTSRSVSTTIPATASIRRILSERRPRLARFSLCWPSVSTPGYVLARTSDEYRRLRLQSAIWEPATARFLDRIGIPPGARCLDVGCGPGEVLRLLVERVGPEGLVTGVDIDGKIGREGLAVLRAAGARADFIEGDARELELPTFDVVYVRLVLMHLADPVALLRRLHDRVAPGGVLIVQDYDTAGMDTYPRLACWSEFTRVMDGVFAQSGGDPRCGLHLPAHF